MQIIRPYGSSRSKQVGDGLTRVLVEKAGGRAERDIPAFAGSHNELVIAQWISTIDKIARKPAGRKRPSLEQRTFRQKLGNVCWMRLMDGHRLAATDGDNRAFLANLWWFKIHPYGEGTEEPRPRRDGSVPPSPGIKGRWYEKFAGSAAPQDINPPALADIAARIEQHLYANELRIGAKTTAKRRGKIEARANSIRDNVLRMPDEAGADAGQPGWTPEDLKAYAEPGDPVRAIGEEAVALEASNKRMSLSVAAEILFRHWPKIFRDPATGAVMNVREALEKRPALFALHQQLKQSYSRLLKRTGKDSRVHRKQNSSGRRLSALLPRDIDDALKLSAKQAVNADLGGLVRLGKIIHYTASDGSTDHPRAIKDNWPTDVARSRFWLSQGQAEIKRAEAFVRIWRHGLVLAGLTLLDWVSMKEPFEDDILGGVGALNEALEPGKFERGHFDRKLELLFGNRNGLFNLENDARCLELLRGLIDGTRSLRNAVFHFKGRGQLVDELAKLPGRFTPHVRAAAQRLWRADAGDRAARLKTVLRGAHAERLLTPEQAAQLLDVLAVDSPADLPLPRFARVLKRAHNAWHGLADIKLPGLPNLRALENPAVLCQYTVLKLVYERPFRSWLKRQTAAVLSGWIDDAVARSTAAAKSMNARGDAIGRQIIAARAADLPKPPAGGDITDFFFELSAATASEMRVQRGYESDVEKAREQAAFIDNLQCDVMALAFSRYLSEQKLEWTLDLSPDKAPAAAPTCALDETPTVQPAVEAEDWQAALYVVLHLLPVESVARLLHQLFKWEITSARDAALKNDDQARLQRLFAAMALYLDMHDAKFEGGSPFSEGRDVADLFESAGGFGKVFPHDLNLDVDRRIPRRGLREVLRFGHLPLLKMIAGGAKIGDATIERVFAMEARHDDAPSKIAALQGRREQLHDQWVTEKSLGEADLREYCETVSKISEHRREANFVNLVDHVRAHRIIMAVLGRLIDFVGLFERDLYFAMLALLQREGQRPENLFDGRSLEYLLNGQIIFALRAQGGGSPQAVAIRGKLVAHFTDVWSGGNPLAAIRNNLAHLNMLQGDRPAPQLTLWINQVRQLMGYDRKLKNAVSKSVIELIAREGIELRWDVRIEGTTHDLVDAQLSSRSAKHLGGKLLTLIDAGPKPRRVPLEERLLSNGCVAMVASAFDGRLRRTYSIVENLSKVDWAASAAKKIFRDNSAQSSSRRPERTQRAAYGGQFKR